MAFQELLDKAGGQGRFQVLQMVFLLTSLGVANIHTLLENFTAAIPGHRCWVHALDNETVSANGTEILNSDVLVRIFVPLDSNLRPEKCRRFLYPQWQFLQLNGTFTNTSEPDTESCMDGWVYDQSHFHSTIVNEWDLVCGSQILKSVSQFIFMVGGLMGSLIYGHLSDRFGRRLVIRWCFLQVAVFGTCVALAPSFLIYCSLRFLTGLSYMGVTINSGMLVLEWTEIGFKAMVVTVANCATSMGQVILGGLAFGIREWRTLQLVVSVPFFVFLLLSRWLVESARWLIVSSKPSEGLKELRKTACINGIKNAEEILTMEVLEVTMQEELEAAQTRTSAFDLFRTPNLRKRTCILCLMRFSYGLSFYGLALNLQHLGSNISLFQVLYGAVTLLARCIALWALNHMGRRISQMLFLILSGLFILATTFVAQEMQMLSVSFAALGICSASASSTCISVYRSELIPTVLRGTALGIILVAGRIGGTLAPLLMTLAVYVPLLPWIMYGVFPILAGLFVVFLPETRNIPLPDTIQELENRFGWKLILRCCFLQLTISGTCTAFAPTFSIDCSLRFLVGFSVMTIFSNTFILSTEDLQQPCLNGGYDKNRWLVESSRWLIITNNLNEGLEQLKRVAHINGKKNIGETLNLTSVKSIMQKELDAAQIRTSILDLFRTPRMCVRTYCVSFIRFANTITYFGLALNLQHWGSNIFLLQILFGVVTVLARPAALLTLNPMGHRLSQTLFSFTVGLSLLITVFVPQEMQTLRVALATLGAGASAAFSSSVSIHLNELMPTTLRGTATGISGMVSRCAAALAPLLMTLEAYSVPLPWIIYGVFPILAGLVVFLLPETKNQPLPDTIQDVENGRGSRKAEQKEIIVKVTQF